MSVEPSAAVEKEKYAARTRRPEKRRWMYVGGRKPNVLFHTVIAIVRVETQEYLNHYL